MSGSSLTLCLLVEGREQSTTTQFCIRPSSLPLCAGWGKKREGAELEGQVVFVGEKKKKKGFDGQQVQ